tara:strand:+ start:1319 stop:1714 length:396 start_codon:yes stop_codon:yes gene_type:complete
MSTVVATNINTDALVGNASANAITVRGEGSATTSLQQGLLKVWCATATPGTISDSFNVSGQVDGGTGTCNNSFTNNFATISSSPTGGSQYAENDGFGTPTTSGVQQILLGRTDSLSNQDGRVYFHVAGDLA